MFPRFRIVTVSMQRLQVRKERITIATVVMVYLDPFTLRGSVNPLLEAEDMPLDFLPGDVLPGHHQGGTLCFGT